MTTQTAEWTLRIRKNVLVLTQHYLRYRLWRIFTRNGRACICLPDGSCCLEDE